VLAGVAEDALNELAQASAELVLMANSSAGLSGVEMVAQLKEICCLVARDHDHGISEPGF